MYNNLWFSDWEDFDENCYLVREGIKSTLIRKENGEFFLKPLFWSYDWKIFDKNLYETTLFNFIKYSVLIRKDTKKPLLDDTLFEKYINFNDEFLLGFRLEDGLTTLIKKSDGSLVFEDLWLKKDCFIKLTDKTYGVVNNNSLDIYNYN